MRELVCLLADVERGGEGNGMRDERCGAGGETPIASDPGGGMTGEFFVRGSVFDRIQYKRPDS